MQLSFGVSTCSLLYRPRLNIPTITDRNWISLHTYDFSSLFSITKQQLSYGVAFPAGTDGCTALGCPTVSLLEKEKCQREPLGF